MQDIQDYHRAVIEYEERESEWKRVHKDAGHPRPRPPGDLPPYLALYFTAKQWGMGLWAGGILNQPALTWDLMTLAGSYWEYLQRAPSETIQAASGGSPDPFEGMSGYAPI